jgi:hypothetical protein
MISHSYRKAPFLLAALIGLPLAQAAGMSHGDYDAAKARIGADFKIDDARCNTMSGNARSICEEEAKGTEKVARADLEYSYTGKARDQRRAKMARVDSAYSIAREKCGLKADHDKDVCTQEAKANQTKSLADIKMGAAVGDARTVNADDKREADYKVALEKCDATAGDAKDSCIAAAKLRFGKS